MTDYESIFEVMTNWSKGTDFSKFDTFLGIKFLWLSRIGQMVQFIASLTILAEIFGKERLLNFKIKADEAIDLRSVFNKYKSTASRIRILSKNYDEKCNEKFIISPLKVFSSKSFFKRSNNSDLFDPIGAMELRELIVHRIVFYLLTLCFSILAIKECIFVSQDPFSWGEMLVIVVLFISTMVLTYNFSYIVTPTLIFFVELGRTLILSIIEFFIVGPILFYLKLSEKEGKFKAFSFVLFSFGFFVSLLFP